MRSRRLIALPLAAALAIAGAAVTDARKPKLKHTATVRADPNGNFSFNKKKVKVRHGKVTLFMKNPKTSGQQHGIAISGNGRKKVGSTVNPGLRAKVHFKKLAKGTYTFYCPVPGHRAFGMKGTLVVK
jgi:uncharacterized cupredoxin-like copper-binding protein